MCWRLNTRHPEKKRFFGNTEQSYLTQVPWLYFHGSLYFLPKLFATPTFWTPLEALFPDHYWLSHACYALSSYLVILFGRKLNGRTLFFSRMQIRLSAFRLVCPSLHDQERFLFGVSCLQNPQSSSFKFLVRKWGEAFQIPPYFSLKMSYLWNFSVQLLWVLFFLFVSLVTSSLHVPLSPCLLFSFTSLRQFDGLSHVAIWLGRCTSFGVKVWNSDMIASE